MISASFTCDGGHSSDRYRLEQEALAFNTLFSFLKVLRFFSGVPQFNILVNVIKRAQSQLTAFLAAFFIIVMAFGCAFHLTLGPDIYEWRALGHSIVALLRFTVGDVDLAEMQKYSELASFFYMGFLLLVTMVGLNIFLSILIDARNAEKAEAPNVDLAIVMKAASRRQLSRLARPFNQLGTRWQELLSRLRMRRAEWKARRSRASEAAGEAAAAAEAARAAAEEEARQRAIEEEARRRKADQAEVEAHMDATRREMEDNHLHLLYSISSQIKALCFWQDSNAAPMRGPLTVAFHEMEKLRVANRKLKDQAIAAGVEELPPFHRVTAV
jgi:uncharacterized protein YaiL (DUF2058 family)